MGACNTKKQTQTPLIQRLSNTLLCFYSFIGQQ